MTDPSAEIGIQPVVSWPRRVAAGNSYPVTVDLRLADPGAPWPYDEEEFAIGCILDGQPVCSVRAIGDAGVVLHRFGGTYGPARFVIDIPEVQTDFTNAALWLTLTTTGGVPFHTSRLPLRKAPPKWSPRPYRVVAAIDFGTYGTGFAWVAVSADNAEPARRRISFFEDWERQNIAYPKNRSAVLLDGSG
ncbi:MAG: hypothetical protein ABSB59_35730, partial [Streptosporangiaceae bacterium]